MSAQDWSAKLRTLVESADTPDERLHAELAVQRWCHELQTKVTANPLRFYRHVKVTDSCWFWRGNQKVGYGYFGHQKTWRAHRLAYFIAYGSLDKELVIDHLCEEKLCVRPTHLEQVSPRENSLRANTVTTVNSLKTHCASGHPFSPTNMFLDNRGFRKCRKCELARSRDYEANRRKRRPAGTPTLYVGVDVEGRAHS